MAGTGHFPARTRNDPIRGSRRRRSAVTVSRMTVTSTLADTASTVTNPQAQALAERLEQGARALIDFAGTLTDAEWQMPLPKDGRKIGVIVHHVAAVYPIEVQLAQVLAKGQPVTGVTWPDIHAMNAQHAADHANVTRDEAIAALRRNSADAAAAIRQLSDQELATASTISLYEDAPLTCQFMLEDHAVRHSYHHLFLIRRALRS